jgi:hypothetical protein
MKNNVKIEILSKEIQRISDQMNSVRIINTQILGAGLVVISTVFTFGMKEHIYESFLVLPYLLLGILHYNLLLMAGTFTLAAYKGNLENHLNKELGENVIQWEYLAKKHIRSSSINIGIYSVYFMILIGCIYIIYKSSSKFIPLFEPLLLPSYFIWGILTLLLLYNIYKVTNLDKKILKSLT